MMESEGQEDESLEESKEKGLQSESLKLREGHSSKVNPPLRRPSSQLWLHAALMCGRDFLYAVEVVLVTPIMLQLGLDESLYSYIWFCSPTMGMLLGPFMGNWSDRCTLKWGRRRPFILGFVIGTVIALTLMIFSRDLAIVVSKSTSKQQTLGLVFAGIGTQVMDFCLDQLETPLRAFTLDVCSPSDQERSFALQTLFMGLGAALGFIVDGVKWEEILGIQMMGLQIKVVYAFAVFIWITTAAMTLFSIKEVQWMKPKYRNQRSHKSATSLRQSNEVKPMSFKTREIASDSCVLPKRDKNLISRQAIENGALRGRLNNDDDVHDKLIPSQDLPTIVLSPALKSEEMSRKKHKGLHVGGSDAGFALMSPVVRSITLLPRISLCKSVFMTMSCPEGLNDAASLSSTTAMTSSEDDSSDDEDDSTKSVQDDDLFGSSMPNLRDVQSQRPPATFLEILKDKFIPKPATIISSEGSAVDPENIAILGENAEKNFDNIGSQSNSHCGNVHKNSSKEDIFSPKNEPNDKNSNMVARKLNFDPKNKSEESIVRRRNGEVKKGGRRKSKRKTSTEEAEAKPVSTRLLWLSIVTMPMKLRWLCFSLLTSFMGIEVLLLWYTNIFGRVVYGGDPQAPANSTELRLYNDGVHMGCWGLTLYAGAVMVFSVTMEHFNILSKVSLRIIYSGGQLLTAISTLIMFFMPNKFVILSLSWTIGITVSSTLTVPYVLVGKYHRDREYVMKSPGSTKRGYGTDCAILACQMYAGNLLYAAVSGPVITLYGGVRIVLIVASLCHTVAFVSCVFLVTYPGERNLTCCRKTGRTLVPIESENGKV